MWYVVQSVSGEEERLKQWIEKMSDTDMSGQCFIPIYEEVRRSHGICRIFFRRLFPGYLFVETDAPEELFRTLKKIPEFKRLLGTHPKDEEMTFVAIAAEEEAFLRSLMEDGVLHVSYLHMKGNRIDKVAGPLAGYRNHIAKLDIPHRRAIVEMDIFGRKRKIRFALRLDGDPEHVWLSGQMGREQAPTLDGSAEYDIGIYPGDVVTDETGLYGDYRFIVEKVDTGHRIIHATFRMGDSYARIQLRADDVSKVTTPASGSQGNEKR